jgi:hypothetical protein
LLYRGAEFLDTRGGVKSRKITYLKNKSSGVFLLPLLEGLNGTKVAECALRELAIVEGQIVPECNVFVSSGPFVGYIATGTGIHPSRTAGYGHNPMP